jgi:hypothetical protein
MFALPRWHSGVSAGQHIQLFQPVHAVCDGNVQRVAGLLHVRSVCGRQVRATDRYDGVHRLHTQHERTDVHKRPWFKRMHVPGLLLQHW